MSLFSNTYSGEDEVILPKFQGDSAKMIRVPESQIQSQIDALAAGTFPGMSPVPGPQPGTAEYSFDPLTDFIGPGIFKGLGNMTVRKALLKPNANYYYRGIGKEGLADATESGIIRSGSPKHTKVHYGRGSRDETIPNIRSQYSDDVIIGVPKSKFSNMESTWSKWITRTEEQVPFDKDVQVFKRKGKNFRLQNK